MKRWAHIRITEELKQELDALKRNTYEPYHSVIKRLVDAYKRLRETCGCP
jgi:predicted DNA-binding protein